MGSRKWWSGARLGVAIALVACTRSVATDSIVSRISIRNPNLPGRFYGEVHRFPPAVRDYSEATLFGWTFREDLPSGAVREIQVSRLRSPGAYLIATDLFANGRFSTMSHTVLMVFPRRADGDLYRIAEQPSGDLHVLAPDGSTLVLDGVTGAVRPSRDFYLAPLGPPGTPPGLHHRGFHLRIHSVGRSPFLRGTPVEVRNAAGSSCRLRSDDLFLYGSGPESDIFRFETDDELFSYVAGRCPSLTEGPIVQEASAPAAGLPGALPSSAPVPILVPASASAPPAPEATYGRRQWRSRTGGLLWQLFSP